MTDIHSHILFGLDDGAPDFEESVRMLKAAKKAGFDTIIATPHVRKPHYDKSIAAESMSKLKPVAQSIGIKLIQGFEYNISSIAEDGIDGALQYCTEGTKTLLLEMKGTHVSSNWESIVFRLQREGADVIIAHPERYINLYGNDEMISRMIEVGCKFQVDLAVMSDKRLFSKEKKFVKFLLQNGCVRWASSDAHRAEDYISFAQAFEKYGNKFLCTPDKRSYGELIEITV